MTAKSHEVTGVITDVFFHRFVLETADGKVLADVGPRALESVTLKEGDVVRIEGERKPSEIKVSRIAIGRGAFVATQHGEKHAREPLFTEEEAKAMARAEGYVVKGPLNPKKKHYETSATKRGRAVEIHIHRDGVHEH